MLSLHSDCCYNYIDLSDRDILRSKWSWQYYSVTCFNFLQEEIYTEQVIHIRFPLHVLSSLPSLHVPLKFSLFLRSNSSFVSSCNFIFLQCFELSFWSFLMLLNPQVKLPHVRSPRPRSFWMLNVIWSSFLVVSLPLLSENVRSQEPSDT